MAGILSIGDKHKGINQALSIVISVVLIHSNLIKYGFLTGYTPKINRFNASNTTGNKPWFENSLTVNSQNNNWGFQEGKKLIWLRLPTLVRNKIRSVKMNRHMFLLFAFVYVQSLPCQVLGFTKCSWNCGLPGGGGRLLSTITLWKKIKYCRCQLDI